VRAHLATLVDDLRRHGRQRAVVAYRGNRQQVTTCVELATLAERFAALLIERQIGPGERVILWGANSAEWIAAFFGCVLRGVLAVPLDAAGGADFAQRVIDETRPRLLLVDSALLPPEGSPAGFNVPHLAFDELASALPPAPPPGSVVEASLGSQTPLQILFTSGTTSEPKGIVHTHRNVLASLEPIEREMQKYLRYERIFHPLRFLHTLPLSHVFGQFMGLWIPPLLAAEVHFESRLQAPRLLELIRRERISVLAAVPRVLDLLKMHLEAQFPQLQERIEAVRGERIWWKWWSFRDLHRAFGFKFWAFVCGGASLPPALESFWSELGFALIQGYGMTETAALITLNHPFHIGQGTLGKPLPGRELRIGADGEIQVRGEMVSTANWREGRMQTRDDPWLATGDLVEQDEQGQIRFRGRKSETIVTAAGLNVHPEDVEAALNRQPGVKASAVLPLEQAAGSEAVAVLIFNGTAEQAQDAVDAANATLAEFQRVRRWKLWPQADFPRSGMGKIQRRKVAQWVSAQPLDTVAGDGVVDVLSAIIASIMHTEAVRLEDGARFDRDLNLDSLARVQLQTELEQRLGAVISDEEFLRINSVGELRARLAQDGVGTAAQKPPKSTAAESAGTAAERRAARFIYPRWAWWPLMQAARAIFIESVMRPLTWLLAAPRIVRLEEPPVDGAPLLIIANHISAYDGALVLHALPGAMRRHVAIAMSGEGLEDMRHARNQGNWFLNLLAPIGYVLVTALFHVFPLPRTAGFRRSFAHAGEAMDRGYHVLVFPEGRRSDGALQSFRSGIGVLARDSSARILPVALVGLGELKQRKRSWFRSGSIEIRIGRAITPDPRLDPEELTAELHCAISALMEHR
jgi:long-chain acyl-CoA synthetase